MLPFRSQVTRTKRKTPLELKLELASLKLSNEQLTKENEALNKINTLKLKQIKRYQLQLRGAHVSLTKLRKRLDLQCVVQRRSKYSLKESFNMKSQWNVKNKNQENSSVNSNSIAIDNKGRTVEFMAKVRFLQHTCMLSFQKTSLALELCFDLFFGCNPPPDFIPSPSTLSIWNNILGEADRINLRNRFSASKSDFHLWADDSNKGGNDRHAVGVHTWNNEAEKPEGLILGYSLVSSGSGKDQAEADFHVISKQFGIKNVGGMVGDNAKTQTGHIKGLVKQNSELFQKQMFIVGCYPHVLNITLRRSCQAAFGSKGDMNNAHICQLQYKIGWLHHERPNFYKNMYVVLDILDKPPPLPQMWVETRWEYLHKNLEWCNKYGSACLSLARKIVSRLPASDSHLAVWKQVIKVSSSPLIQVEQVFLSEFLDIFIIPALEYSQSMDKEMGFGPGYLARLWPFTVRKHILTLKSYQEYPSDYFPKTESQILNSLKDAEQARFFRNIIQASFVKEAAQCIMQHGSNWLEFPKFFAAGADSRWNNLFWRAVLRVLGR